MKKKGIPPRLQPQTLEVEDPQVTTDLTISRTYDPAQINSLQSLGLIKVDGERFRSIGELGKGVSTIGMIHLVHGAYMVSADNLLQCIAAAGRIVAGELDSEGKPPTRSDRMDAAKTVGYLAGALARVNGTVIRGQRNQVEVAIAVDKHRRNSFAPGVAIPIDSAGRSPANP